MLIEHPQIGICGLSCRLCPSYHIKGQSKCDGCKSEYRMRVGCPFITCAVKRKGLEFCWQCDESAACEKWQAHREFSQAHDTFVCYQKLEDNIAFVQQHGIDEFKKYQLLRERYLLEMLDEYNEGRSKRYYSIAATVLEIAALEEALLQAKKLSANLDIKEKSKIMHAILDEIAEKHGYHLRLRK